MEAAAELRALARVERDPRKRVRPLAIANVREGMSVEDAARATGMGRATLYRWLAREQTGGPAAQARRGAAGRGQGLGAGGSGGRQGRRGGVAGARRVRAMVERRFQVKPAPSGAYRLPDELHLSALVPRAPATATPTRRRRPPSGKLPRAGEGDRRRLASGAADRGLVPG